MFEGCTGHLLYLIASDGCVVPDNPIKFLFEFIGYSHTAAPSV